MKRIFLLICLLLFSGSVFAQEQTPAANEAYDCKAEQKHIVNDLAKDVECVHDEECGWFDYGYPWQPAACMKAIINTTEQNHNLADLRLIEEYNYHCIYPDKEEKKKYDDFTEELERSKCTITRTYCYKGFCRIKDYARYNDD